MGDGSGDIQGVRMTVDDPHGRLALPEMEITGHTLEQLHAWLYGHLADNWPRGDLRYLAGVPEGEPGHRRFRPGNRLFGVLVI